MAMSLVTTATVGKVIVVMVMQALAALRWSSNCPIACCPKGCVSSAEVVVVVVVVEYCDQRAHW
eukprot:10937040-Karenia_brevis.AAC.1